MLDRAVLCDDGVHWQDNCTISLTGSHRYLLLNSLVTSGQHRVDPRLLATTSHPHNLNLRTRVEKTMSRCVVFLVDELFFSFIQSRAGGRGVWAAGLLEVTLEERRGP